MQSRARGGCSIWASGAELEAEQVTEVEIRMLLDVGNVIGSFVQTDREMIN